MDLYGSLVANEGSGGGEGTTDIPIKSISVNGSGVAPVNKNVNIDVPTKTSDLTNDSNFASTSDIPTKVSELNNDSKFITDDELTSKGYASISDIPTKVSQLDNDSNFASTSDIPTKVSQLTNDSKFVTESDLTAKDYADKTYVGEQIAGADHLKREIIDVLPEPSVADEHTIYMLKVDSVQGNDKFKEYMLIEGVVQCVGDTSVDLTDYAKTADVDASISTLQTSKADLSTLKEHTDNVDIHVTTEEKTKIDSVGTSQGRNIIQYPYASKDGTSNGITWTVNDDGTITADGTATNNAFFNLTNYIVGTWGTLHAGTYTITDGVNLPIGGVTVQIESTTGTQYKNKTFTVEQDVIYKIFIYIQKGTVADNITFKPMLEVGAIAHSYEPTTESNVSLKSAIDTKADKSEVCVNLFNSTLKTNTVNGVTCTNNGDGTYTLNGTSTKDRWISFGYITLNHGKYKFIATENNVEVNNLSITLNKVLIAKPGDIFTIQSKSVCDIGLSTFKKTFDNVIIKPMLTTNISATYYDFVSYTGDGKTLSHDVAKIKKDLGGLTFSASETTLTITDGTHTWTLEANN